MAPVRSPEKTLLLDAQAARSFEQNRRNNVFLKNTLVPKPKKNMLLGRNLLCLLGETNDAQTRR